MIKILLTGGMFQFLNAGLGIIKVKYFLDLKGSSAMAEITSILAIWGLIALLAEDIKLLFRTEKISSFGVAKDIVLGLKSNLRVKTPIIICSIALITTTDGLNISLDNLFIIIVILCGYVMSLSTSILIGRMEAKSRFNKLNILQLIYVVLNFALFFPLVYSLSALGFLINVTISCNLLFISLYINLKNDRTSKLSKKREPSELVAVTRSKIYLYVIALQACTYMLDPMLISFFVSDLEAVEYSLIRRIGLILTVSSLSLGPYFSTLGSIGLKRVHNLTAHLSLIALTSSILYLGISSAVISIVFESSPPNLIQYQIGMIALGIANIKTSALISSFSRDDQIYLRFRTLTLLVPLSLIFGAIGIYLIGGFIPLYFGALFLITYEKILKKSNEKS
jgi:hypothetical protein